MPVLGAGAGECCARRWRGRDRPASVEVREVEATRTPAARASRARRRFGSTGATSSRPATSEPSGLTCRVYRRRDGRISPLPDREDIREALRRATERVNEWASAIGDKAGRAPSPLPDTGGRGPRAGRASARRRRPSSTGPATTAPTRSPGTSGCSTPPATTSIAGVRFLAVNSNDAERYPADSLEAMRERVDAEGGWPHPYLHDESQEVGRATRRADDARRLRLRRATCGSATAAPPTPITTTLAGRRLAARGPRRGARGPRARARGDRPGRLLDQVEVIEA